MKVINLELPGVKLIKLAPHFDQRGFFVENYRQYHYQDLGIVDLFVQDNYSFSKKKTLRGMHFQKGHKQAKLIFVILGEIYDVFVDMRRGSPTFGKYSAHTLCAKNKEQLYIPRGFAHGFAVLSETAHVLYKVSTPFCEKLEKGFCFNDPDVNIEWPIVDPLVSEKDRLAPRFHDLVAQ